MPSLHTATGRFSLLSMGLEEEAEGVGLTLRRPTTPVAKAMRPLAEDVAAKEARQSAELARALRLDMGAESNPLGYRTRVIAMTMQGAA